MRLLQAMAYFKQVQKLSCLLLIYLSLRAAGPVMIELKGLLGKDHPVIFLYQAGVKKYFSRN